MASFGWMEPRMVLVDSRMVLVDSSNRGVRDSLVQTDYVPCPECSLSHHCSLLIRNISRSLFLHLGRTGKGGARTPDTRSFIFLTAHNRDTSGALPCGRKTLHHSRKDLDGPRKSGLQFDTSARKPLQHAIILQRVIHPTFIGDRTEFSKSMRVLIRKISGAPGGTRTPDLLVRSQTLYPTELRARSREILTQGIERSPRHAKPCRSRLSCIASPKLRAMFLRAE